MVLRSRSAALFAGHVTLVRSGDGIVESIGSFDVMSGPKDHPGSLDRRDAVGKEVSEDGNHRCVDS